MRDALFQTVIDCLVNNGGKPLTPEAIEKMIDDTDVYTTFLTLINLSVMQIDEDTFIVCLYQKYEATGHPTAQLKLTRNHLTLNDEEVNVFRNRLGQVGWSDEPKWIIKAIWSY
jgi:hypothetical protein